MPDLSDASRDELVARLAELNAESGDDSPNADANDVAEPDDSDEPKSLEDRVSELEATVAILAPVVEYHRNR